MTIHQLISKTSLEERPIILLGELSFIDVECYQVTTSNKPCAVPFSIQCKINHEIKFYNLVMHFPTGKKLKNSLFCSLLLRRKKANNI